MDKNIKYYLAIDWGLKKMGLAIADEETQIATALKTVGAEKFWQTFSQLLDEFDFAKIIVGGCLEKDKFKENTGKVQKFVDELKKKTGIEVVQSYEGFSSKIAQQNIKESGGVGKQDDAESARIILQGWLDEKS